MYAKLLQLCLTLSGPKNYSSSVHGILQARILEWIAIPFSRGPSWSRDLIQVSCIADRFFTIWTISSVQFSRSVVSDSLQPHGLQHAWRAVVHGVTKNQTWLSDWTELDCSMTGFPVHHQLPELTQTHVHWVGDAIQPSHPLSSPSLPAFNLPQHQGFSQWVSSLYQVAKVLEFQLQHQSFQWIFRTDFL